MWPPEDAVFRLRNGLPQLRACLFSRFNQWNASSHPAFECYWFAPLSVFHDIKVTRFKRMNEKEKSIGAFDLKRRCAECSPYDIKVPREWFECIGSVCSLIALAVLWCHTVNILRSAASSRMRPMLEGERQQFIHSLKSYITRYSA